MKFEKVAVFMDEQELLELETIVLDGDKDEALQYLHRLRRKIEQAQTKLCAGQGRHA